MLNDSLVSPYPIWLQEPSQGTPRLIFARHGQYGCNVRGVCNSDPRIGHPLTDLGRAQAVDLGRRLEHEGIELVVTSEFLRARETAWLANRVLRVPQVVNRLANENRVGQALEGRPSVEFQRSIAHAPSTACAPDGEPFMGLLDRVTTLVADLRRSSPATVLVVTHGWVLQAVRVLNGELSADEAAQNLGMPGNCEIVELRV